MYLISLKNKKGGFLVFHKLLIIGAGASGVTAALAASENGCDTGILEGGDRILKKILSTGNGRCNITNSNIDIHRYHGTYPQYPRKILSAFSKEDAISFFEALGLPLVTLEEGKVFPMSLQASSVIDILRMSLSEHNINIYLNSKVTKITRKNNTFKVETQKGDIFTCERLILACGGSSAPQTGSDGSGYKLASSLCHKIIKPLPALVQLKLDYDHLKALSGVKIQGSVKILVDNKEIRKEDGEILFTDYGISGPPILQISRIASLSLNEKKSVNISLDLFPDISYKSFEDLLMTRFENFSNRSISENLIGVINKKMIPIILKDCGISDIHELTVHVPYKDKIKLCSLLKDMSFVVNGTNSFKESQVTAGGVDTNDISDTTLMSKLVPNLYFAGELMDVDGDCGGFNLQWAWSSGYTAGINASK